MIDPETIDRLQDLVGSNLGATLIDQREVGGSATEVEFIVLWKNHREWGTHRALLSTVDDDSMLVWGHYYRDSKAAMGDFARRAA